MVDELTDKIAAADQPRIAAACRSQHMLVHGAHVARREADVGTRHGGQLAVAEDPAGAPAVGPAPGVVQQLFVPEYPLVGGRAHGQRADLSVELVVQITGCRLSLRSSFGLEQPVQRVARIGNEAVEAGGSEVLRLRHAGSLQADTGTSEWARLDSPIRQ